MRLFAAAIAPNPSRVTLYVEEKGIDLDVVSVDLRKGEHTSDAHRARNPAATLPVLELDDGRFVTESLPIVEYLEERFPEPPMIGIDSESRALVRSVERDIEMSVFLRLVRWVHAANSPLGLPPDPHLAEYEAERLPRGLARVEARLDRHAWVAGDTVTIADCTLFAGMRFARIFGWALDASYVHTTRWYAAFEARNAG